MDRIPESIALTTSETASLLEVHPSTVKRWCNDGELDSELTPGGHRRISIHAVTAFAQARGIRTVLAPFHPYEPHVWTALKSIADHRSYGETFALALQWVLRGEFERLEQLFLTLGRSDFLSLTDFCDSAVRGLLGRVGEEWESGKLRVGDEHMVSNAMTSALLSLRREWIDQEGPAGSTRPTGARVDDRPVAVVGTIEGNRHGIGALCVRMLLEREGWKVFYAGADLPVEDFAVIQKSRGASLVCVSLPSNGSLGDVTRVLSSLRRSYDRARPYSVAFGGLGSRQLAGPIVRDPFEAVGLYDGSGALLDALRSGLGVPPGPSHSDALGAA